MVVGGMVVDGCSGTGVVVAGGCGTGVGVGVVTTASAPRRRLKKPIRPVRYEVYSGIVVVMTGAAGIGVPTAGAGVVDGV